MLVDLIKSGLKDLKDEIKEMSENEIEVERLEKMADLVQGILEFKRQNQEGQRLKILTPEQMFSRLIIFFSPIKSRK